MSVRWSCAVTGASGYVGSSMVSALEQSGAHVRALSHHEGSGPDAGRFVLGEAVAPALLAGTDALIHCAWDLNAANWKTIHGVNVGGSIKLFQAARDAGVGRIVFLSSMSAFSGCKSLYGRSKLAVEAAAVALGADVLRPGLVYGPRPGGMVGAIKKLLRLPVIPLVGSGRQLLYLAHEEDLAALAVGLAAGRIIHQDSPLVAAHPQARTFREIIQTLALAGGKTPRLIPFPWQLEWLGLKTAELVGIKTRLRSDSLISLIHQDPAPDFAPAARTGVTFRTFDVQGISSASSVAG